MNWPLLIAGILTALAAVVHTFGGEATDIHHLLASDIPMEAKIILRGVWHTFSITLGGSALLLFYEIFAARSLVTSDWLRGLAIFYILCGLVMLGLMLGSQPDYLLRVPQWLLLLVLGGLIWWGTSGMRRTLKTLDC